MALRLEFICSFIKFVWVTSAVPGTMISARDTVATRREGLQLHGRERLLGRMDMIHKSFSIFPVPVTKLEGSIQGRLL